MTEQVDASPDAADTFSFNIDQVRIGDSGVHPIGGVGTVTVIVGANNVGKSTVLAQIHRMLFQTGGSAQPTSPRVVTELSPRWTGTADDAEAWIRAHSKIENTENGERANRPRIGAEPIGLFREAVQGSTPGRLTSWFVHYQTAAGRIGADTAGRLASAGAPPTHPLHILHTDRDKFRELARIMKRLFKINLFLDTVGQNFELRIGEVSVPAYPVDSYDPAYDSAVAALPTVQSQGDGIRAALGLLLPLIASLHPLVLIDEPEAFLHPPQARIVGIEIGKQAKDKRSQVIVATHDRNILRGIIESDAPVTILHLTRNDDDTIANALPPNRIAELWKDPALRYTNALDGLFHSAVIIAESERDAQFYHAAIDYVRSSADSEQPEQLDSELPEHNLMFLGSNGKTNMARIVRGLRDLGIKTVSTPDLDILNEENVIRSLVDEHGGDWSNFEDDYRKATAEFGTPPNVPTTATVKASITQLIDGAIEGKLTQQLARAIEKVVKLPATRWSELKKYGTPAIKSDKAAANSLMDKLDAFGVVLVKVGELENFVTTTTAPKGPEFLSVAFEVDAHKSQAAMEHAERLLKAAGIE